MFTGGRLGGGAGGLCSSFGSTLTSTDCSTPDGETGNFGFGLEGKFGVEGAGFGGSLEEGLKSRSRSGFGAGETGRETGWGSGSVSFDLLMFSKRARREETGFFDGLARAGGRWCGDHLQLTSHLAHRPALRPWWTTLMPTELMAGHEASLTFYTRATSRSVMRDMKVEKLWLPWDSGDRTVDSSVLTGSSLGHA